MDTPSTVVASGIYTYPPSECSSVQGVCTDKSTTEYGFARAETYAIYEELTSTAPVDLGRCLRYVYTKELITYAIHMDTTCHIWGQDY